MASYVYNCRTCEIFTEVTRGMTEPEIIPVCEQCAEQMHRIYTSAPVQFKGSGFYKTGG